MSLIPDDFFCATPTIAAGSSSRATERPLPRVALKMRPTRGGSNSASTSSIRGISKLSISSPRHHQAKPKIQSQRQRLVQTAPRVPDTFGEERHALPSLPTCRLRMRPSKDHAVDRTPVQRVSFIPPSTPILEPKNSSKAPLMPLSAVLPTYLLFPDLPSNGENTRTFILKPKSLARACHSPPIAG